MSDVWIIGAPSELVGAADRGLAQLGFTPRLLALEEVFGVTASSTSASQPTAGLASAERCPALLVLVDDVERAAKQITGDADLARVPLVVVADEHRLATGAYSAVGHELLLHPFSPAELGARIARAQFAVLGPSHGDVVSSGSLELNTATYQVSIDGQPIDFTYMEYELLKFLVTNPDRVFSRDALLSNVWGYDYYGGARTVDVHIRRLRAKLGQEHAERIRTLRSVGYRWDSAA